MHAVAGGRCQPAGHGPRFVDALFQDATLFVFAVIHHLASIFRLVLLTAGRIDAQLTEQPFHPEGAGLIGHNRHHPVANLLVLDQRTHHAHEGHGGGDFAITTAFQKTGKHIKARNSQRLTGLLTTHWHVSTELVALFIHVAQFR